MTDDSRASRVFQEVGQSVMTVMMPKHSQQSVPGDGPECDCDIAESAKCSRRWARVWYCDDAQAQPAVFQEMGPSVTVI